MTRPYKLAALLSHPIQYMVPLYQRLATRSDVDLTVYFMTEVGVKATTLPVMGEAIVWDTPVLEGYRHEFLRNVSPVPNQYRIVSKINPTILGKLLLDRPDALYLHGFSSVTELGAFAAAKALRIPILFHGDTNLVSEVDRPETLRMAFRKLFCAGVDAALVMSTKAREYYRANGVPEDRMFWAPLAVDNEMFMRRHAEMLPRREAIKAELGLAIDKPVIMSVVNFRPAKRPMDLIKAWEKLATKASLLIVGDGPLRAECLAYVKELQLADVHLVGNKNQGEISKFYTVADVFALPSSYDLNPLVVREAMCFSLPLVLSDGVQSSVDFLVEGENGFGYPKTDVAALARALDRSLSTEGARESMGRASLERIKPWNYSVSAQAIMDSLHLVTGRSAPTHNHSAT